MTGITKDELEQMAREAGFPFNRYGLLQGDDQGEIDADAMLERLTNAILERAAARCDSKARLLSNVDCEGAHDRVISARELASDIRALKINTGD